MIAGRDFYHCASCEARPERFVQLGHDGPPTFFWEDNLVTGTPLALCPVRQLQLAADPLQREIDQWKTIDYPLYKAGHLLVSGGIAMQPARWLHAMQYLAGLEAKQEQKYYEITKSHPAE